jgi:hypothetical protein
MEDQKGLSLDNTQVLFILINGENQLECSPLGHVEKVLLECKSLLERSGNLALRGFCDFLKSKRLCISTT